MEKATVERRLAAIIAIDAANYSRLMGADEVGTHAMLKAHRAELVDPTVAAHHGRLVKSTGDGVLLEFASVVDAIACAVAIQRGMITRNQGVPAERQIVFRIGINIGDIIIDGGDIFGDGVNIAARLEALCEPGGVCISRAANEQIRDKLSIAFADLGEHMVKNISRAVGVFGLSASDIASLPEAPAGMPSAALGVPAARPRLRRIAIVAVCVLAVGASAAWWFRDLLRAAMAPPTLEQQLGAALARAIPRATPKYRDEVAGAFSKLEAHRAMAFAPNAGGTWRSGAWPTREAAEEKTLEKCQQFYDEPCALIAVNDTVVPAAADDRWNLRDAPRVRYAGTFTPERIPSVRPAALERRDVAGYAAAPSPKAIAIHASGALHVVIGAPSQPAAEAQALAACSADPLRRESGGPCHLYAVGNRVVLPLRATAPITTTPAPPAAMVPALTGPALRTAMLDALARATPSLAAAVRENQVGEYLNASGQKALVVAPPSSSWRTAQWASASLAIERGLEGCQARYGQACALVAVNDEIQTIPASGEPPRRPMARVTYDGLFEPQQIPAITETLRQRIDVVEYRARPGPKAAAFHPWGRMFIVTGAATQRAAEEQALAECNADPQRAGQAGPCLLYAVGDQVVLPRRSLTPLSAAPSAR